MKALLILVFISNVARADTLTQTEKFMSLINEHRKSIGLKALIVDDELAAIANEHSTNMAFGTIPFGHMDFSFRCSVARSILKGGNLCSENVAKGQKTVKAAFDAWMKSPGHRKNIEQARLTHTGFGFEKDSKGIHYWTQIFIENKNPR